MVISFLLVIILILFGVLCSSSVPTLIFILESFDLIWFAVFLSTDLRLSIKLCAALKAVAFDFLDLISLSFLNWF